MHFDEVYHARTATEFLQSWRYGLSHDIYEWTHPHVAKYAMAAGIVAFGNDKVNATSELGVPVVAAAVEPRRLDELAPGGRAGERLHIATGTEIRTYDLVTRDLLSTFPAAGATSLAIDETGNQLVIGYDDGRIATLDLDLIDAEAGARRRPDRPGDRRPSGRTPPRDERRQDARSRVGRSPDDPRPRHRHGQRLDRPGRDRRPRAGRHGFGAHRGRRHGHRPRRACLEPGRDPVDRCGRLREPACRRPRRARRSSSGARGRARRGPRSTRRSPTARCLASRSTRCPASPSPPTKASCSSIRTTRLASRRIELDGGAHGLALMDLDGSQALRDHRPPGRARLPGHRGRR